MIKRMKNWLFSLGDIYSLKDDKSKGRLINLVSTLLATFYNVFITGIFYTGFLTMYGMSITDTGILTFVPYIANLFSIFSPKLLSRFKKRKGVLLLAKAIYNFIYIVLTTVMPQFVTDPSQRLTLFIVVIAAASGFWALFGSGFTIWFYNFFPESNERRMRYFTLNQIFSSVLSSIILLVSGFITDALSSSPYQDSLIIIFRYLAFGLVIIELIVQSRAKEYPYVETADLKISDVFTLAFKYKKFMYCMLVTFTWCFIANLNNGLWNYHLLNHMEFSYTLINTVSVLYTIILLTTSPLWRKVLKRYSWIKTFGISMALFVPTEFIFFCMTKESAWLFVPNSIIQHIMSVGINISYSNIFYINLPEENSTTLVAFNTLGTNIFAFLGLMCGTWISSWTGDSTMVFMGMDVYSVLFTCALRGVLLFIFGMVLIFKWKSFTKDSDIEEIEEYAKERKITRELKKRMKAQRKALRN